MAGMIKSSIHHFDGFVGLAGNGGGSGKDGGRTAVCSASLDGATTIDRWMLSRLQEVIASGQYRHPGGMQFGGQREEASNRIARRISLRNTYPWP